MISGGCQKLPNDETSGQEANKSEHETLKYSLLGPSLLKAGQDSVDQSKVSDIIYNASKGSKYFDREETKDKILSSKIDQIRAKKEQLEKLDLARDLRLADTLIDQLEASRDLSQYIVHVDCDAFYAAVEVLSRPELADVPFAVGGGVLSTCNYAARKFGCRSGMAGFVAKKLCPQLVLLKPDFTKYNAKAQEVREVLARYDPRFESASIDEAYLNITEYCACHNMDPAAVVEKLRGEVSTHAKITVSAGIAANTRLAKICSNINKPNGQYVLGNDRQTILDFMNELPCRKLNGVGRVFERELASVGIKACGDIYEQRQFLTLLFGDKACNFLIHCYLGLGRTRVQPAEEYERKSVGTESTFSSISDQEKLRQKLRWTADELEKDLRRAECKGRTLVLKIKLHTFEVFTRQVVPPKAVHLADDLFRYALPMLSKLEQDIPEMKVRLMGLRCTHLASTKKPNTLAFFGLKPPEEGGLPGTRTLGEDSKAASPSMYPDSNSEWEVWPEDEFAADQSDGDRGIRDQDNGNSSLDSNQPPKMRPQTADQTLLSPQEMPPTDLPQDQQYRRHGKEISANPRAAELVALQEEWWHCPVCLRPQPANERQFNSHIDVCLSRRAILEAVQENTRQERAESAAGSSSRSSPEKRKPVSAADRKRARSLGASDPRQTKIRFGEPPSKHD